MIQRKATGQRETKETVIRATMDLDGFGKGTIQSGIGFIDHMLSAFSLHGGFDLDLSCQGDLQVDGHHTVEDIGIVLGTLFADALQTKEGIARYGSFTIPMDEALATCHVDISGRPYLVFKATFQNERVGELDTCMVKEFFYAFAMNARITLHIELCYGENDHHGIEAIFKAFAHALRCAVTMRSSEDILSTKGDL